MKIIVTGGLGFLGTCLIPALLSLHNFSKLIVLDKVSYASITEPLKDYSKDTRFQFVKEDLAKSTILDSLIEDGDVVIHLAAETFVDKSINNSKVFWVSNVLGTQAVVEAVRKHKIKKLVHISTDEVWGQALNETCFTEYSNYNPRNPYAASKASADHLIRAAANTYDIPYNIVYFTNLYGPYQHIEKFIPKSITNILQGKPVVIYDRGLQMREWLYVSDAVSGLLKVLWEAPPNESYIVGGKQCLTNIDVVQSIIRAMSSFTTDIVYVDDRPGHDFRYAVDTTKIKMELGWEPTYLFEDKLPSLVNWYTQNSEWASLSL